MSLFPHEDVLTKEIDMWRSFIDKLPVEEDMAIFAKLLNDYHKYSVAINDQATMDLSPQLSIVVNQNPRRQMNS